VAINEQEGKQARKQASAFTRLKRFRTDAHSHVGIKDMRPLLIRQIGQALYLLLRSVVVEQDVNLAIKVRLGLFGEFFHFGELAQVASDEFEFGRGRVLLNVLGQVFDVLDFLFVVVEQQVGSLVGAARGSRARNGQRKTGEHRSKGDYLRKDGKRSTDPAVGTGDDDVLALELADTLVLASIGEDVEHGLGITGHVVLNTGLDVLHRLDHLGLEAGPVLLGDGGRDVGHDYVDFLRRCLGMD
jgi:hypothetical protein